MRMDLDRLVHHQRRVIFQGKGAQVPPQLQLKENKNETGQTCKIIIKMKRVERQKVYIFFFTQYNFCKYSRHTYDLYKTLKL